VSRILTVTHSVVSATTTCDRRRETRSVDQLDPLPAMSMCEHPAGGATHHRRRSGLDLHPKPCLVPMDDRR